MDDALAAPTLRPSNPLQDALGGTTPRAPPRRSKPLSPPRQHVQTPPRPPAPTGSSAASYAQPGRARSPPARRSPGAPIAPQVVRSSPPLVHAQSYQESPPEEELDRFAALCRRLYYGKDGDAARQVDSILQRLPASFRTPYARTMATVRTTFHREEEVRRRAHVEDLLRTTQPGATVKKLLAISLESTSIAALRSSAARAHRRTKLREFLTANCTAGIPGTHPFFKALYAALWLQAMDSRKGGAGERCVEWEVDVAVFTETGGNAEWASEAVEALKGVLGMTERIKESSHTDSMRTSYLGSSATSETSSVLGGEPIIAPVIFERHAPATAGQKKEPPPVPPHRGSLRNRSGSDPFLHPEEKALRQPHASQPEAQVVSPLSPASSLPPSPDLSSVAPLLSFASPISPVPPVPRSTSTSPIGAVPPTPPPQFRIFTLPSYLTNPELRSLCRIFPTFISSPARAARLPSMSAAPAQLEEGAGTQVGHGELRVGQARREDGWRGTWWERLVLWLRALFGLA